MLKLLVASILLIAAASGCEKPQTDTALLGEWTMRDMDGSPPPVPSPEQPGVRGLSLTLGLTEDRFELGSTFQAQGDTVQSAPLIAGPWERTTDELRFFPEGGDPSTPVVFKYSEEGRGLVLTD